MGEALDNFYNALPNRNMEYLIAKKKEEINVIISDEIEQEVMKMVDKEMAVKETERAMMGHMKRERGQAIIPAKKVPLKAGLKPMSIRAYDSEDEDEEGSGTINEEKSDYESEEDEDKDGMSKAQAKAKLEKLLYITDPRYYPIIIEF